MTTGLLISAPRSGAGKTTVTLGILAALTRRGVRVRAAKAGPDYIDPAFHAAATGRSSLNLDSWSMPPSLLDALATDAATDADVVVIEGAMGLFDGVAGASGRSGAAADLAARWALPVLLVLDVSGQSQSAAAVLRGFATAPPSLPRSPRWAFRCSARSRATRHSRCRNAISASSRPANTAIWRPG